MMKELDRERAIWSHCYIWVQSFLFPAPSSVSLGSQICAFYTSAVAAEEMQILTVRRGEKRCNGTAGMSTADHMPIR